MVLYNMHFSLRFTWTEADAEAFMEEECVVKDVLKQKINQNRQRTSQSSQDHLHKIIAKYGQTNQEFNFGIHNSI